MTRLTHTNALGVHGAILEAFAVDQSLRLEPETAVDAGAFIDFLLEKMKKIETIDADISPKSFSAKGRKR